MSATSAAAEVVLAAARDAALTLPHAHARKLAAAVDGQPGPTAAVRASATTAVAAPTYRAQAQAVLDAWAACPDVSGSSLAAALRVAADATAKIRSAQSIDVVWTGPATGEVPVRLTREVLLEVIGSASSSLIIVSFAAYKVPDVVAALAAAAGRGVDIRMVLETGEEDGGPLKVGAAKAFAELGASASFYVWPAEGREGAASMHAKSAIADELTALVGSANLTGHAIELNMELGVLIRGGPLPRRLSRHFRALMSAGVLRAV